MREPLFKLSQSQRDEMQRRYKRTTERRVSERIHAILLLDSGRNLLDVSDILHLNPKTIRRWIRIFVDQGLDALCTLAYQGQDELLSPDQLAKLLDWLDDGLHSCAEICAWVREQFGYDYSDSGMTKLLKRHGYRYKLPAQIPAKADREAQAAWIREYTQKKRSRATRESLFC